MSGQYIHRLHTCARASPIFYQSDVTDTAALCELLDFLGLWVPPASSSSWLRQMQLQRLAPATFWPRMEETVGVERPVFMLISYEEGFISTAATSAVIFYVSI